MFVRVEVTSIGCTFYDSLFCLTSNLINNKYIAERNSQSKMNKYIQLNTSSTTSHFVVAKKTIREVIPKNTPVNISVLLEQITE